VTLDDTSLDGTTLVGIALAGTPLVGAVLAGTNLAGITLAGTTLADTTLAGTTLTRHQAMSCWGWRALQLGASARAAAGVVAFARLVARRHGCQ
jgi:uncharacterized protein YjbI with pentapeptide repeats